MPDLGASNILSILGYGLYGLTYLLLYMAYDLLRKEQKKEEPQDKILKRISSFMVTTIAVVVIVGGFELLQMYQDDEKPCSIPVEILENCEMDIERLKTHSQLPDLTAEEMKAGIDRYLTGCDPLIGYLKSKMNDQKKNTGK